MVRTIEVVCREYDVTMGEEITDIVEDFDAPDAGKGPRFTCDMLCDTTCAEECDYKRAMCHVHEMSDYSSDAHVCVRWEDSAGCPQSFHARVFGVSTRVPVGRPRAIERDRTPEPARRVCATPGCESVCDVAW